MKDLVNKSLITHIAEGIAALYAHSKTSITQPSNIAQVPSCEEQSVEVVEFDEAGLERTVQLLLDNCDFLWHFADEGEDALEWAMREKTDITTLRTFVRT